MVVMVVCCWGLPRVSCWRGACGRGDRCEDEDVYIRCVVWWIRRLDTVDVCV